MTTHFCYLDTGTSISDPTDSMSLDQVQREAAIYFREVLDRWLNDPHNPNHEIEILVESE